MAIRFRLKKVMGYKSLITIILGLSFVACSPIHRGPANRTARPSVGGPAGLTTSAAAFEGTLYPLIQTNCASCHGAGQSPEFAVNDVQNSNDALIQFGLVDFTNYDDSRILQQVQADHNGVLTQTPTLDVDMRAEIENWALAGGNDSGQIIVALQPTYDSINARIFVARCNNCHSGAAPAGGLDLSSYATAVAGGISGGVDAMTPENTPIFARVDDDGEILGQQMPAGGTPLTQEERDVILLWIQNGTPEF